MVTIAAMDCDQNVKHCDREGVTDSVVMIYPQQPRPKFKYEGAMDSEALLKFVYKRRSSFSESPKQNCTACKTKLL